MKETFEFGRLFLLPNQQYEFINLSEQYARTRIYSELSVALVELSSEGWRIVAVGNSRMMTNMAIIAETVWMQRLNS